MSADPYRLPRTAIPTRYRLRIEPDLRAGTFVGRCEADVCVVAPLTEIVLNAIELDIIAAWVGSGGDTSEAVSIEYDEELERASIRFAEPVGAGEHCLTTEFTGTLNDKLRGFYRSTFTDEDGTERVIATTQFESTNARRAFPCWDEPDLKAVFDVTLVVAPDLLAVSCGREIGSTHLPDGRREVRFEPTIELSTYLVAWVVGPLEATTARTVDGVSLRVVHPPGKGHLTSFALDVGEFALRHLTDYFAIPYPGDKIDLVAIPDFAFGAMENLGCVTFREVLLLIDPETSTQPEQQNAADVIAHELAHMWFGNLVTMRWWNGIWLKEAFATFIEVHTTDAFRPEWDRWTSFALARSAAFDVDALAATRPVEYDVHSPAEAEGMYDLLTYEKGAAVVRMLEQFLGPETFRQGIRLYLRRHSFGNAETHELWDAIEEASEQPVRAIMESWIRHGGYPMIEIEPAGPDGIEMRQHRFSYLPSDDRHRWGVPVVVEVGAGGTNRIERVLLDGEARSVALGSHDRLVVNVGGNGFYRVHYADSLRGTQSWGPLEDLRPVERYGIIDDTWAALAAGSEATATFLRLVESFVPTEDDLSVWQGMLAPLRAIEHLCPDELLPALRHWVGAVVGPARKRLASSVGERPSSRRLELLGELLAAMGTLGRDPEAIELATSIPLDGGVDPATLAAAIEIRATHGGSDLFDELANRFEHAPTPQDRDRFLHALPLFPGETEIERLLEMVDDHAVRTQDAPYVLRRALHHREHGARVWDFIANRWDALIERFPANGMAPMLRGIRALSEEPLASEVAAFLAEHPVPTGERTVEQHLERLRVNVELRRRMRTELASALS